MTRIPVGPSEDELPVSSLALVVLDGWGIASPGPGNAISLADTPVFDELWGTYPRAQLDASGLSAGLPDGQMGNSEVGHLNLGAGAVVKQDLVRIDDAVSDGSFFENSALVQACDRGKEVGRLHLLGLVSDGGVHSGWEHIKALIELASRRQVPDLVVHAFTDGRDTLPKSGAGYLEKLDDWLAAADGCERIRIGSVMGRYYAMDRDKRWQRTKKAYDALVWGEGLHADTAEAAASESYERGETDEFIEPTLIGDEARIRDGDVVIFFNFRPDRARQLTRALGEREFDEFDRGEAPEVHVTTMTEYQGGWSYPIAFVPKEHGSVIAEVIAERGEKQLHVAETEKYAHVTYFFNGGCEKEFEGEDRYLAPSPQDVPTYDKKPEMSARQVADGFIDRWSNDGYRFGVINFANSDMVGHTGVIEAAVKAIETVDACLGDVINAVHEKGGACIITADHGNADNMLEPDGSPNTTHSTNPVPFVVTVKGIELDDSGVLADVIPTALDLMGIEKPASMTGRSLKK